MSVDSAGAQGYGDSYGVSISADGRYVAFYSFASDLVPGDTNGNIDVFAHDRVTGATQRMSVDSAGAQGNGDSYGVSISADGRYVAFISNASNLLSGDTNGVRDVFVHDRVTGATERVSVNSAGTQGYGGDEVGVSISADGRYVAFTSNKSDLVPGDTNGAYHVYVHDRLTGTTERVSVDSAGIQGNAWSPYELSITADGRYVAFASDASNLVPGDTNSTYDVFVHDRVTGATERVSVDSAGIQGNYLSPYGASITADGRYVAFASYASNLVPGDTNGDWDTFVHDRVAGTTERVSVDSAGTQANSGGFGGRWGVSISTDGRYVAFDSDASNLVPGDTNGVWDVFVHDRVTGTTERVSVDSAGTQGNSGAFEGVSISADGRYVAFDSRANNLVAGDTNGALDVFVHERCPDGSCSSAGFKLPYAPNAGVVWTGGPHALLAGGQLQGTFPPGKGSGMDFSNGNFDVLAIAAGTVKAAHCDDTKPLGCIVAVEHAGGVVSVYAHLQAGSLHCYPCADPSKLEVTRGEKIAKAGGTGTGANGLVHLHLELRQGNGTPNDTVCSGNSNENPTSDCFGDPLDWDGRVIDGWTIHEYFKPDRSVAYNYDGSATKGITRAVPDFPYSDGGRPSTPTILRTVAADVGTTYPTCVSAVACERNTFSRPCMPGPVATSTPPPAPTPDPCSSLTQFGGSGVLGGGGRGGAQFRELAASHIESGDDLGELTSTNQPAAVSVGGVAEQPDVTALPSVAASSGRNYTLYILGVAGAVLAALGAGAWATWRRRRAS